MELKLFEKDGWEIRTIVDEKGHPWFAGKDVAIALGYENTRQAIKVNVKESHRKLVQLSDFQEGLSDRLPSHMKNSSITVIDESGLYSLILRSNKPEAEDFQEWVTNEVLPSIRKHGGYIVEKKDESPEEFLSRALRVAESILAKREERLKKVEEENRILNCDNRLLKYNVDIQKDIVKESLDLQDNYYDFFDSGETFSTTEVGKLLKKSAIWLNRMLADNGVVEKVDGKYEPTEKYIRMGLSRQVASRVFIKGKPTTLFHYRWTTKGVSFIKRLFIKHINNDPNSLYWNLPKKKKKDIELTDEEVKQILGF